MAVDTAYEYGWDFTLIGQHNCDTDDKGIFEWEHHESTLAITGINVDSKDNA